MPSVLYKLKTFLSSNPMYYFDDSSKIYIGDTFTVFKAFYEMPTLDQVDEWVIVMESLLKDVYSVTGSEQVLLEAFVYQAILIYFFKNDQQGDELFKILAKIRDQLFLVSACAPETLILIQILTGMYFEDKKDQMPLEAEKSYLTALMCMFQVYGDPRGRGNSTMPPYALYLSWKLSLLSLAEDKKVHDSEFAEELFDASLRCMPNHKRLYKDQQLQMASKAVGDKSKWELEQERAEVSRGMFDMRKYRNRPFSITRASGQANIGKRQSQQALSVYVSQSHHGVNQIKSKSQVPKARKNEQHKEYDLDPSDIDLDIEDENKNFFVEENFKNNEWFIGVCPFSHWSLYRSQISQIIQAHNLNKDS